MYATAFLAILLGASAVDSVLGAAVPSYVSRHRARHTSMPGLKLIRGQVKTSSYIVSSLLFPGFRSTSLRCSISPSVVNVPSSDNAAGRAEFFSFQVKLADTVSNRTAHLDWANSMVAQSNATDATGVQAFNQTVFDGYAAELDDHCVSMLLASEDVAWVEEDAVVRISGSQCVHILFIVLPSSCGRLIAPRACVFQDQRTMGSVATELVHPLACQLGRQLSHL